MLTRLRNRAHGQEGFTLIELLVVILIIGILAAVAIPTFLSQKGKAQDANVQSNLNTVQLTESTYDTSNNTYVNAASSTAPTASNNPLVAIEPSLVGAFTSGTGKYPVAVTGATPTGYTATAASPSGITYVLGYANGTITRSCSRSSASVNASGCTFSSATATTGGTWGQ